MLEFAVAVRLLAALSFIFFMVFILAKKERRLFFLLGVGTLVFTFALELYYAAQTVAKMSG